MPISLICRIPGFTFSRGDIRAAKPDQMAALVRVAAHFRTLATAHPALKLPNRRLLRAPQRREIHGAVHGASGAFDFEVSEARIQRIADRRGRAGPPYPSIR
jgi:hypothetical protein